MDYSSPDLMELPKIGILDNRIEVQKQFRTKEPINEKKETLPISVIIPAYNSGESLIKTMNSIYNSKKKPLEVIVVDDHSDVNIEKLISTFNCTYVRLKKNSGPSIARNVGVKVSVGAYLLFIDDDIEIEQDTLAIIDEDFSNNPNHSAVVGLLSYKHPNKDLISRYKNFFLYYSILNSPEIFDSLYTSICSVKKKVFFQLNGFDEELTQASVEDVDLGQRMVIAGYIVHSNKRLMVVHYKKYTLKSFIKNEFIRSYDRLSLIIENKYFKRIAKNKRYLNSSPIILLSTILSFITLLIWPLIIISFFPLIINILLIATIVSINFDFIKEFSKYNKISQTLLVPFVIYFDLSVASLGIVSSLVIHFKYFFSKK